MNEICEKLDRIFSGLSDEFEKLSELSDNVNTAMKKHYAVNHKPIMFLDLYEEFAFIINTCNEITTRKSMALIRGVANNGTTFRIPEMCGTVFVYDEATESYVQLSGDYTVRCEKPNGREILTLLYVQTDYDLSTGNKGNLTIHFSDCPMNDIEILVHIGTDTTIQPNVDELLSSDTARSLYVFSANPNYGNFMWTVPTSSPITKIYVQRNLTISTSFNTPSLVELALPNVNAVPANSNGNREALRIADFTNARSLNSNCFAYAQIGDENGVFEVGAESIAEHAFRECKNIHNLRLRDSVISISQYCFLGCSNLTTFECSNNLSSLPTRCFESCAKLQKVSLGLNLKKMESNSFSACAAISTITVPQGYRCLQNYFTSATALSGYNGDTQRYHWECFREVIENSADLTETDEKGFWHVPSTVLSLINADADFVAASAAKGWYFST